MKKFIILIVAILLIGTVAAQESCDSTIRYYFGPYCTVPVNFNLTGFYPIGSYIEFYRADQTTDIGRVLDFSWQAERQAFAYHVATSPFYQVVQNGISGINEVVMPEQIFAASEPIFGQ